MALDKLRGRFTARPRTQEEDRRSGARPPANRPKTPAERKAATAKRRRQMVKASRKANRG
jgi:hypothetical protein